MAPAKTGRRSNRQEKKTMTTTMRATMSTAVVGNRRPFGFAFSKFGRVAALHARRKIAKDQQGIKQRGRAGSGLASGRNERVRLDATVLDANMLRACRCSEAVVNKQDSLITGRLGESAVHKYFVDKLGSGKVNWMNEVSESGLPYDITITKADVTEYVEVKATSVPNKNWFHITRRELQFAAEKGDSLTIAYVLLSKPDKASIVFLKNPHQLIRQKDLKPASINVFLKSRHELLRQRDLKPALLMSTRCEKLVGKFMEQMI